MFFKSVLEILTYKNLFLKSVYNITKVMYLIMLDLFSTVLTNIFSYSYKFLIFTKCFFKIESINVFATIYFKFFLYILVYNKFCYINEDLNAFYNSNSRLKI